MDPIVLASTSEARRGLLQQLGVPFLTCTPEYEEVGQPSMDPMTLVRHHARGKARSVAAKYRGYIVVGSDQVAVLDGEVLGKPGNRNAAIAQLSAMSGLWVDFLTGLAVVRDQEEKVSVERFQVRLRDLTPMQVASYVDAEQPFSCAGSFRIEGLGIALMAELSGRDYTTLIGLPLIALCDALRLFGVEPLCPALAHAQQ